MSDLPSPKIYLLPNLMTAGNLFCGFAAVLRIYDGAQETNFLQASDFHDAIWFILAACIFDLLDGRLARLGGHESAFGREFDSLADIVSFGIAPALLVYQIVLGEFQNLGWMIAFVYLACGALRLARFNCVSAAGPSSDASKHFSGFPIPAAAGVIASITLFLLWLDEGQRTIGRWKYALPPLMLFLSFMMFSKFRYPSFKAINWRTTRSIPSFFFLIAILALTVKFYQWMAAVIFLSYLLYGFLRPFLSPKRRRVIEEEIGEEPPEIETAEEIP